MAAQRRRRQPLSKGKNTNLRKKRVIQNSRSKKISLRDGFVQLFIGLFIVIDVLLIVSAVRQCSKEPVPIVEAEPEKKVETRILQIEVLNGCGVPKIASRFTDFLRAAGVDVVKTDNYIEFDEVNWNVTKTILIDRRGNIENAHKIADILELERSRVLQEVNEAYLIDATLILGSDFRDIKSWARMEAM